MAFVGGGGGKKLVDNTTIEAKPTFVCVEDDQTAATILISLGAMGIGANVALMAVILLQKSLRR